MAMFLGLMAVPSLWAQPRPFELSGIDVTLEDATSQVLIRYQSLRLNRSQDTWDVDITVSNRTSRPLGGPFLLSLESFSNTPGPIQPDGMGSTSRPFFDLSTDMGDGWLVPGEVSRPRRISLARGATGLPELSTRLYVASPRTDFAMALARTLNEVGQPLEGVTVEETGPGGSSTQFTESSSAAITLGRGIGLHRWKFSHPDHLPVWREATMVEGRVELVPSPRLVRRGQASSTITALDGGAATGPNPGVRVEFNPGGPASGFVATLTPLTGQTLPWLLPLGWSPMQAFWLETSQAGTPVASAILAPIGPVAGTENLVLAQLDEAALQWRVKQIVAGNGTNSVRVQLDGPGAYALVLADTGPRAPPVPRVGELLGVAPGAPPDLSALAASGTVEPPSRVASRQPERVTAHATVLIGGTAVDLPSGLVFPCEIEEDYRLQDGARRGPPVYDQFVVAYQRPGDVNPATLHARFPLRPLLLFGAEELASATVKVDLLSPSPFAGGVLDQTGGFLATDRVVLLSVGGETSGSRAARARSLDPARFADLVPTNGGFSVVAGFELTLAGGVPASLLVPRVAGLVPGTDFVLARVVADESIAGLTPMDRLAVGANRQLFSLEPGTGERLPGISRSGQYLLLRVTGRQAMVRGVARNSAGLPTEGLPVRVEGQPWLVYSEGEGAFRTLAPVGSAELAITDPATGDTGFSTVAVVDPGAPVTASLNTAPAGPRVVAVSPANESLAVARVTPIEIGFSEPVNPATLLPDGIQLLGGDGQPVAATLTLNLANTRATLLPVDPLAPSTVHTIVLSPAIADPTGLVLEGSTTFSFSTASDLLDRAVAQLIIYQPGATNIPPEILDNIPAYTPGEERDAVVVYGKAGSAEPERPVILINESTGQTSTTLSKPDGSFYGLIQGAEEDFVSASIQNANGTATYLPVSRQEFDNGFVGLYAQGGILEAETDAGPVEVSVASGAITSRAKFKLESFDTSELLALLNGTQPTNATLIGAGLQLSMQGEALTESIDISIPVDPAELELAGLTNGVPPEEALFALVAPVTMDGEGVYVLLDKMEFEDGRLLTRSPPFPGADSLIQPADRVSEALRAVSYQQALPRGGGAEIGARALAVAPLILAERTQPLTFAGKVFEVVANEAGDEVAGIRPLAGALVTVSSVGSFSSGRPGRLTPGSICCVSSANGAYAMLVPQPEVGDPLNPSGSPEEFMLMAGHPFRLQQVVQFANPTVSVARFTDIIFPAGSRGPTTDESAPRVSVFHTPTFPAPGVPAQFVVLATHGSGQPSAELQVLESDPPELAHTGAIDVSLITREVIGPTAVRSTFNVMCPTNAVVTFKASSEVGLAPRVDVPYAVAFRASGFPVQDPLPSNVLDVSGPQVVRSVPRGDLGLSAPALAPGEPILIEFGEAVSRSVLDNPGAVVLEPDAGDLVKELSADQRFLTVRAYALEQDTAYTLTLNSQITDIVSEENRLDQNLATPEPDPFVLKFRTAPIPGGTLSGIENGGGVVMRGIYGYALERAGSFDGAMLVYDLSDPEILDPVAAFPLSGYPRDLALIPEYSFRRGIEPASPVETRDLLAVVGGKVGGGVDEFGNLLEGFQYLRIIDIEDPDDPVRLAGATLTLSPSAAVTKVLWSPPFLAYLESDADGQAISLLNLQSFILSSFIDPNQFSPTNNFGVDANGDGDYVDIDDELPIPAASQFGIAGRFAAFGLEGNTQRLLDFDWVSAEGFLGVTLSAGQLLDVEGNPVADLPSGYLTLAKRFIRPGREAAFVPIPDGRPKRVHLMFGVEFVDAQGRPRIADFALVSVDSDLGPSRIEVIEVTDPSAPELVRSISIPPRHGLVQSIRQRDDGLLMVATTTDILLLDPTRLTDPTPQGSTSHPSMVGLIAGAGSGARAFDGGAFGYHVANLGGKNVLKQVAPQLSFVGFSGPVSSEFPTAIHPDEIRGDADRVRLVLSQMQRLDSLPPARFRADPDCDLVSTLSPPAQSAHYYVLVNAPGSAGDTIELALETLNERGYPRRNKGRGFPPVQAISVPALQAVRQQPRAGDAPIRSLTAYQLSREPTDPLYNLYLSKPFALVVEPMTQSELVDLKDDLDREILWSGHYLRATLDFSLSEQSTDNPVLSPFAAVPDPVEKVMRPGAVVVGASLPGEYFLGPNPSAAIGHAALPGTLGAVAAHNGEIRTSTVDFSLPSRRMGIVFERTIAGQDLYDGPFGRGWDFNYNQRFVPLNPDTFPVGAKHAPGSCDDSRTGVTGDLLFFNGAANAIVYRFAGDAPPVEFVSDPLVQQLGWFPPKVQAYYHSPTGVFDLVLKFSDHRVARLLPDGTQFWYSPAGRLESIHHRYTRNYHTLLYNDRGELVRIKDHSVDTERHLDIGYYRDPAEAASLSPLDTTTENVGEIGKVYRLVDFTGGGLGNGRDVRFKYSEPGELIERRGIEVVTAHPGGFTGRQLTRYDYHRGVSDAPLFELANDITGITGGDPGGASMISLTEYQAGAPAPTVKKVQGAQGPVELEVLYANTAADLAAGRGRVRVRQADQASAEFALTAFGFPEITEFSGPAADAVTYKTFRNGLGLPVEMVYPLGNRVVYTYEETPNLRSKPNITRIERFARGNEAPLSATMTYDPRFNFQSGIQIDVDGHAITNRPTADGLDIGTIEYPKATVQLPAGFIAPVPVGLGAVEIHEYNEYGQLVRQVDVNGVVRSWLIDRPDGYVSALIRGEPNSPLRTTLTYSGLSGELGLPERSTPARIESEPVLATYDEREQLITSQRGETLSKFEYDENGRLIRRASLVEPGKELVEVGEYLHNGFLRSKRLLEVETGTQQTLEALVITNTPDAMFRVVKVEYPGGESREFKELDHLGRPRRMNLGDYEEVYTYDDNNNLQTIARGNAVTEYIYDGHDRLKVERRPTLIGQPKEETLREYFDSGALKSITVKAPDGAVLSQAAFQVDALGRIIASITDSDHGPVVELFSYDGTSRVRRTVSANGEISSIHYDIAGRPQGTTNSVRGVAYTYDRNDNLERVDTGEGPGGRNVFRTEHVPFDRLDRSERLSDSEGLVMAFDYRLDGVVARSVDGRGSTNHFEYTRLKEPIARRLPSGVEFHQAYDQNRQMLLEGDREDLGWTYAYDDSLRLESHALRDGQAFTFSNFDSRNQPRTIAFPGMTVGLDYDLKGRLLSRNSTYLNRSRSETNTYDALDRITSVGFDGASISNSFDRLGPLRSTTLRTGGRQYAVQYAIRPDSIRTNVAYPSSELPGGRVREQRDLVGRLLAVLPEASDPVVSATSYEAADLIGVQTLGPNLIDCENVFDGRRRLVHRRYLRRTDGQVLAELHYAYDANNNIVGRQSLHRAGRVDFFHYDRDDRLIRADIGVRPAISNAAPRQLSGFAAPAGVAEAGIEWSPGYFARGYTYDGARLDRLTTVTSVNPDALVLPAFATTIGAFDTSLHAGVVDGFSRGRDTLGNTTNTMLRVRVPGSAVPVAVGAALEYDAQGQLVRLSRTDGVIIDYQYLPSGLCYRRKVTGPPSVCVPSDRVFVWDGVRLIEEYEIKDATSTLRARYFYTDSDVPMAADFADAGGTLRRHYFLVDIQGSMTALVDSAGEVVERYAYDAWGQPQIEAADTQAPVVRSVTSATDGLLIEFSERVLPGLSLADGASTNRELAGVYADLAGRMRVEQAGLPIPGTLIYEESRPGFGFGTVVRFQPVSVLSGNLTLRIQGGAVNDEWNNPSAGQEIGLVFSPTPGTQLFVNPVATSSSPSGRTIHDQPFLFHGQYFDFEAGLVYMRARFYDPFVGVFLQPDPAGYADSVNPYAGFANNPQTLRDPSGELVFVPALAAIGAVIGGVIAGAMEYNEQGEFNQDVLIAGAGGAVGGAIGGFTAGGSLLVEGALIGGIGGIAGGAMEAYFRGEQYSPELVGQNAVTGLVGGFAGAAGSRAVGSVLRSVLGSLDALPGGVARSTAGRGRVSPGSVPGGTVDSLPVRGRSLPGAEETVDTLSQRTPQALPRGHAAELAERTVIESWDRVFGGEAAQRNFEERTETFGINLFNKALNSQNSPIDQIAHNFENQALRDRASGFFDVGIHGSEAGRVSVKVGADSWERVGFEVVGDAMERAGYHAGDPIRLCSCYAGRFDDQLASYLSRRFNAYLIAPENALLISRRAGFGVADDGRWVEFLRGRRLGMVDTSILR